MQIIGHRGSRATHAENTLPGFLHAMESGADGVELDVVVTLDDQLVVTHDMVLPQDGRVVRRHRAADLPLPTLDEVLSLAAPETFCFDIEAKHAPGMAPDAAPYAVLLSAAIRRSRAGHRILVRSFEHDILRAFHEIEPGIPLSALISYPSDEWAAIARSASATNISPHYSTVTSGRVASAHEAGVGVSVWTVNEPEDWGKLTAMGVDSIITDDPARLVNWHRYHRL